MNNMDKYATVLRYFVTMVVSPFAAKYITDAVERQTLMDALIATVLSLVTLAPLVWNLFTRPSSAAMEVAVKADKVMAGEAASATVRTPNGVPDIVIAKK